MTRIQSIGRTEIFGGYGDRKALQVRKVKRYERLGMWEILEVREVENFYRSDGSANFAGWVGRKIWEDREVRKFWGSPGLEGLAGQKNRLDPLAGNECDFAASCTLRKVSLG
jgi:hypothetical protein